MLGRLPGWRYRGSFYLRKPIDRPRPRSRRQNARTAGGFGRSQSGAAADGVEMMDLCGDGK